MPPANREILFEFKVIGGIIRATAIDPVSGIEVVVQGPASAGQAAMQTLALKKLDYVLNKKDS